MIMQFNVLLFLGIFLCLYVSSLDTFSQQTDVLKEIPLSSSASLIVKRIVDVVDPATMGPFKSIKETYVIIFKNGSTETLLDRAEFRSIANLPDSSTPRFSVYDAVLDSSTLHYFFVNKGQILLATAQVDGSGAVSGYHQKALPENFSRIDTACFVRGKDGKIALKVREPGKKTRAFQFDSSGEAVSVPSDQISSTSAQ